MKFALALAVAAAFAASGTAQAQEPAAIKFAIPIPPQSAVSQGLVPWAEAASAASQGTLQVQTFLGPGVANLGNAYDRVINGVIEIAFGNFGPLATQFPKTAVTTLPFETRNGTESTLAFWRLYANGTIADEYAQVKPITLLTFPGVNLHGKKVVRNLAELKGLKVAAQGRIITRSLEQLGAVPVAMTVGDLYQALSRNTIEAAGFAWSAMLSFKLYEETSYHLEVPLGNDDVYVVMNKDAYARLPARARAAIDSTSGEVLTKRMIGVIDASLNAARTQTGAMAGHTIASLTPDEEARWAARVAPVVEEWTNETPDGKRVLAAFRDEVKKIRAGN